MGRYKPVNLQQRKIKTNANLFYTCTKYIYFNSKPYISKISQLQYKVHLSLVFMLKINAHKMNTSVHFCIHCLILGSGKVWYFFSLSVVSLVRLPSRQSQKSCLYRSVIIPLSQNILDLLKAIT